MSAVLPSAEIQHVRCLSKFFPDHSNLEKPAGVPSFRFLPFLRGFDWGGFACTDDGANLASTFEFKIRGVGGSPARLPHAFNAHDEMGSATNEFKPLRGNAAKPQFAHIRKAAQRGTAAAPLIALPRAGHHSVMRKLSTRCRGSACGLPYGPGSLTSNEGSPSFETSVTWIVTGGRFGSFWRAMAMSRSCLSETT